MNFIWVVEFIKCSKYALSIKLCTTYNTPWCKLYWPWKFQITKGPWSEYKYRERLHKLTWNLSLSLYKIMWACTTACTSVVVTVQEYITENNTFFTWNLQDKTKNFPRGVDRLLLYSCMEVLRPEPMTTLFSALLDNKGSTAFTVPLHVTKIGHSWLPMRLRISSLIKRNN